MQVWSLQTPVEFWVLTVELLEYIQTDSWNCSSLNITWCMQHFKPEPEWPNFFFFIWFSDLVFYNPNGFGLFFDFLDNHLVFFLSIIGKIVLLVIVLLKNWNVIFKNEKSGKWFRGGRKNLTTLEIHLGDRPHTYIWKVCQSDYCMCIRAQDRRQSRQSVMNMLISNVLWYRTR